MPKQDDGSILKKPFEAASRLFQSSKWSRSAAQPRQYTKPPWVGLEPRKRGRGQRSKRSNPPPFQEGSGTLWRLSREFSLWDLAIVFFFFFAADAVESSTLYSKHWRYMWKEGKRERGKDQKKTWYSELPLNPWHLDPPHNVAILHITFIAKPSMYVHSKSENLLSLIHNMTRRSEVALIC